MVGETRRQACAKGGMEREGQDGQRIGQFTGTPQELSRGWQGATRKQETGHGLAGH